MKAISLSPHGHSPRTNLFKLSHLHDGNATGEEMLSAKNLTALPCEHSRAEIMEFGDN